MADMTFDGKILSWGSRTWAAVSGPWGHGTLPAGVYYVERKRVTPLSGGIGAGFQDKSGKGFFVPLTPRDDIGRTGLGIHPDGGSPGTEGCIGITQDSASFYEALSKTPVTTQLTLEVRY